MAGNLLGPRSYYRYVGDDGTNYAILTDDSFGAQPAFGLALAQEGDLTPPRRFKPRIVYCETPDGVSRKGVPCGTPGAAAYATGASRTVAIDGVNFQTTGRRGEKASFPRFAAAGP